MVTLSRTGSDEVLERAVTKGGAPSVVALAADRNGIIN